jgi:transposase
MIVSTPVTALPGTRERGYRSAYYQYSPTWEGKYPQRHLKEFEGVLQADGYKGFAALYEPAAPGEPPRIQESSCWAHCRRHFEELYRAMKSPVAAQALARIGQLYRKRVEFAH